MTTPNLNDFQEQVANLLLRHRSLLDIVSKCDQANSSVHRAVTKAITECGCIEVNGKKQPYTENMTVDQAHTILDTHVTGDLCDTCTEVISEQLGKNMFYIASLCNVLNINLQEVVEDESKKCATLGIFKMA